jgi:flagellar assembly protein FliH
LSSAILRATGDVRPWEVTPFRETDLAIDLTTEREMSPPDPEALLAAATHRAAEIIQHARREADALRTRTQLEAEQLRRAGQEEGYAAGQACAHEEWDGRCRQAAALIDQLGAAYADFCRAQGSSLAVLAVAAAEKLLLGQLTLEPERVVTIVNEVLTDALATSGVTLHLHPDDVEIVTAHLAVSLQDGRRSALDNSRLTLDVEVTDEASGGERRGSGAGRPIIRLASDATVERGGCWLESEQGEVDATVSGRLNRLARVMGDE